MLLKRKDGPLGREVYSVSVATADELVSAVTVPPGQHFVLFVAWDASKVPDEDILDVARALVLKGLCYVIAWGPDCERVHDLFDAADIELNPASNSVGGDTVIMSTWHDKEPLEEALWFSLYSAYPAPPYDETAVATVVATIGESACASSVDAYLANLAALDRAVGV
jgi:hypothetical protein